MKASTLILSTLLSASPILATDFFGTELSDKCIAYIRKADPIVNKVGPQFESLESVARGTSVEQAATEANAAVQSALKLYQAQKDGSVSADTVSQDKLEIQKDLKKVKPAINSISAASDASPAVLDAVRALNSTRAEAMAYGKAGVGSCGFADLRALKKASSDAQNGQQTRNAVQRVNDKEEFMSILFSDNEQWEV